MPQRGLLAIGTIPVGLAGLVFNKQAETTWRNPFVIGGMLIADLIMGKTNPWEKLYDPGRKILDAAFVKENANAIAQYAVS